MSQPDRYDRSLYGENRKFPPPRRFSGAGKRQGRSLYKQGDVDYEAFWAEQAKTLDWYEPWHTVLEWDAPFAKWFVGGKLNASYNCLDRHVNAGRGDKVAYYFEGEPGDTVFSPTRTCSTRSAAAPMR